MLAIIGRDLELAPPRLNAPYESRPRPRMLSARARAVSRRPPLSVWRRDGVEARRGGLVILRNLFEVAPGKVGRTSGARSPRPIASASSSSLGSASNTSMVLKRTTATPTAIAVVANEVCTGSPGRRRFGRAEASAPDSAVRWRAIRRSAAALPARDIRTRSLPNAERLLRGRAAARFRFPWWPLRRLQRSPPDHRPLGGSGAGPSFGSERGSEPNRGSGMLRATRAGRQPKDFPISRPPKPSLGPTPGMQKETRHSPNRLVRRTRGKRKGGAKSSHGSRQQKVGGMGWSRGAAVNASMTLPICRVAANCSKRARENAPFREGMKARRHTPRFERRCVHVRTLVAGRTRSSASLGRSARKHPRILNPPRNLAPHLSRRGVVIRAGPLSASRQDKAPASMGSETYSSDCA